ncbi:MAG: hypothetical protein DRK00_06135 [Thermoprotei archaeon]|nr:MAG: hypothetical protein DRK00_06135 [Thermoprotei archaeon]
MKYLALVLALATLVAICQPPAYAAPSLEPLYPRVKVGLYELGAGKGGGVRMPTPKPEGPNKWAVVIGIADYEGRSSDLWHPDEDAKEFYKALTRDYGFPRDHVVLLLNKEATANAILAAIDWLLECEDENSTVVFFFSGHGYNFSEDVTYPKYPRDEEDGVDEAIVSYDFKGITDDLLAHRLSGLEARRVFICIISCFSGGMDDIYEALRRGERSVVLVTACGEHQLTYDVLQLGNTVFGYYYIDRGILRGEADGWGGGALDGIISVEEAFSYADYHVNAFVAAHGLQPSDPEIFDSEPAEPFIP